MTPQNALLGVSLVSRQQSKAMGSEEQGVTLHRSMSQSSSRLAAWHSDELLGLGCYGLKQKGFPVGLYSAFTFGIQFSHPSSCASRKCLSFFPTVKKEKTKFPKLLLQPSTLSPQSLLTMSAFNQDKIQSEIGVQILHGELFYGPVLGGPQYQSATWSVTEGQGDQSNRGQLLPGGSKLPTSLK